ncbi:MAG: hypothetical protein ACXAEX_21435 [Promethearchaeota archaeon]
MSIPKWMCINCEKEFIPMSHENDFSFNCPFCASTNTIPYRTKNSQVRSLNENVK